MDNPHSDLVGSFKRELDELLRKIRELRKKLDQLIEERKHVRK